MPSLSSSWRCTSRALLVLPYSAEKLRLSAVLGFPPFPDVLLLLLVLDQMLAFVLGEQNAPVDWKINARRLSAKLMSSIFYPSAQACCRK